MTDAIIHIKTTQKQRAAASCLSRGPHSRHVGDPKNAYPVQYVIPASSI